MLNDVHPFFPLFPDRKLENAILYYVRAQTGALPVYVSFRAFPLTISPDLAALVVLALKLCGGSCGEATMVVCKPSLCKVSQEGKTELPSLF